MLHHLFTPFPYPRFPICIFSPLLYSLFPIFLPLASVLRFSIPSFPPSCLSSFIHSILSCLFSNLHFSISLSFSLSLPVYFHLASVICLSIFFLLLGCSIIYSFHFLIPVFQFLFPSLSLPSSLPLASVISFSSFLPSPSWLFHHLFIIFSHPCFLICILPFFPSSYSPSYVSRPFPSL